MTKRSTIRALVCLLLVIFLCAPALATTALAARSDRVAEFRAVAAPSYTVLLTRASGAHDDARRRSSAPSVFTLDPLHGSVHDASHLAAATEERVPAILWTVGPWTGRSPPAIS